MLLLAIPALSIHTLSRKSATFDEPINLFHGLRMLATRDLSAPLDYAPLPRLAAAASARLFGPPVRGDLSSTPWAPGILPHLAQRLLYLENDADRLLFWGRLAFLPLHLALALAVFVVSRELWGLRAGIVSLLLVALSPSVLAHAPLITADFPVTALLFLAFAAAWRAGHGRAPVWLAVSGLALGLALLAKLSALFALPVFLLCFAIRSAAKRRPVAAAGAYLAVVATALLVVWGAYSFRYAALRDDDPALAHKRVVLAEFLERSAPESAVARGVHSLAADLRLLPEPYLLTLRYTLQQMQRKLSFFLGRRGIEGDALYFPVAFLLKTPVALQLLLVASLAALARGRIRLGVVDAAFLLLFPALYFAAALFAHMNLGHRHLLPIYPFLFVLAGGAAAAARSRAERLLLALLLVWFGASSLRRHPHHLAYFNELAGGPRGGIRYLGDSNLDWGQDLAAVGPWMARHGVERIKLAYFGTALPGYYGFAFDWLPSVGFANDREGPVEVAEGDWLAVSATCLQGFYFQDMEKYRFLDAYEPVDVIGNSIYVYHLIPERRRRSRGAGPGRRSPRVAALVRRVQPRVSPDCGGGDRAGLQCEQRIGPAGSAPDPRQQALIVGQMETATMWRRYGSGDLCALAAVLLGPPIPAWGGGPPVPVGPQFLVNTYTTGNQIGASVSTDADGDFVVVWQSAGSSGGDTSGYGIQGQRYDSGGSALGSDFQVNTYTTGNQASPWVAAAPEGDFVVVWQSAGSSGGDSSGSSIQGQRYDSAGSALGSEFQVNSYTTGSQSRPQSLRKNPTSDDLTGPRP